MEIQGHFSAEINRHLKLWQGPSLLHLLDLRAYGQERLQGPLDCHGLDMLVTDQLTERLLQPDRLTALLASTLERRLRQAAEVDQRVTALQDDVSEAARVSASEAG